MALATPTHQAVQRATQAARNAAARYHLAQQRGQEPAALRPEVARLRALEAKVRALFAHPHASIPAEDWQPLRNALGLGDG